MLVLIFLFGCLAGTSLGDPIEVGAALAVLGERPRQQPLTMVASKSWVGHAEPAAGLVGLLFAQQAATGQLVLPIMHLATVNPYVSSTLEQTAHAAVLLPKESSPLPRKAQSGAGNAVFGVSAFAFQGTNAHATVAAGDSVLSPNLGSGHIAVSWLRKRHYVAPEAHLLAETVMVSAGAGQKLVVLQGNLLAAQNSFLWGHQVMGKAIFPGVKGGDDDDALHFRVPRICAHGRAAAKLPLLHVHSLNLHIAPGAGAGYFELGGAALRTLLPTLPAAQQAVVASVAIPAPLMLPSMQQPSLAIIQCTVAANSGQLEISSLLAASTSKAVHVTASAATLLPVNHASQEEGCHKRRPQLLPTPSYPAPKQAAVGGLEVAGTRSGFWLDPAAFDCFLQLGQVLIAGDNVEVFVPAGLGALQVASGFGAGSAAPWASVLPVGTDAAPVSDFKLASSSATPLCVISHLVAKSMGKAPASSATAAAKAPAVVPAECLYEVAWQAMTGSSAELAMAEGQTLWHLPSSQQQPPTATASIIAAAQRLLKSAGAGAAVQLRTAQAALLPFMPPHSASLHTTAAALSGLVRTLNQECPQISWSAADVDGHSAYQGQRTAARLMQLQAPTNSDAFGLATRGNALFAPSLVKSVAQEQLGAYHLMPMPRGSLNSLVPLPVDVDRRLGSDEVVLAVKSVGLNFRWGTCSMPTTTALLPQFEGHYCMVQFKLAANAYTYTLQLHLAA